METLNCDLLPGSGACRSLCLGGLARPSLLPEQITGSQTSDVFYHGLALNNLNHLFLFVSLLSCCLNCSDGTVNSTGLLRKLTVGLGVMFRAPLVAHKCKQ